MNIATQILLTLGASMSLLLACLSLLKRTKSQADYLLSFMHVLVFIMVIIFAYNQDFQSQFPWLDLIIYSIAFLVMPVFYLYVKANTQSFKVLSWKNLIHVLPFSVAVLFLVIYVPQVPYEEQLVMLDTWKPIESPFWYQYLYFGLYFGIFPVYLTMALFALRAHRKCITRIFSYEEDVNLMWLNHFIYGMFLVWIAFLYFAVFTDTHEVADHQRISYGFLVVVLLVLYQGVYGLRQQIVFTDQVPEPIPDNKEVELSGLDSKVSDSPQEKYQHSGLSETQVQDYLKDLQHFMETEKPYLEMRITISDLSKRCGIPVNTLSQVINDQLDQNFFDFINSYRVEEFKRLAAERNIQQFTLLSLAHEAGFNSKSTFNAIFKKFTGLTPSEFTRSAISND